MARHHVVLVPGFFGFGNLGALTYFVGVKQALEERFREQRVDVQVTEVPTLPTASIRHRAARVLETLAQVSLDDDAPIHVIGHSTGGLDARLAIAPTASLPTQVQFEAYERVRSLVTVATPHFGTPLATAFSSAMGKPILHLAALSLSYVLQYGRLPLGVLLKMGEIVAKLDDRIGLTNTVADQLYRDLLSDLSTDRRAQIAHFIEGVTNDQSLLFQLTPAGCDLLNASTADPQRVRYGSVVTRSDRPRLSSLLRNRHDVYAQSLHAVYTLLYRLSARGRPEVFPAPVEAQRRELARAYGELPTQQDNDGVVPTLSQVWGEVIAAVRGDHLDVVGHYGRIERGSAHADWLPSHSGFDSKAFDAVWGAVARFVTREVRADVALTPRNVGRERTAFDAPEASRVLGSPRAERDARVDTATMD